jgi:predicted AlkP superfamily pyrophosphatase or phosphodiesterase
LISGAEGGLASSEWIAEASDAVDRWFSPTLLLAYLPHLDYDFQRYGVNDARSREALRNVDAICGRLIERFRETRAARESFSRSTDS